jgi:hypothetical protein
MPLVVITALFSMSLLAAWVLFKLLQSTATVTKPEYQLGGAAAGFVVILSILSLTYMQVNSKQSDDNLKSANQQIADLQKKVDIGKSCLEVEKAEVTYAGSVSPALQEANVIFAVKEAKVQQDGRFAFKVQSIKPSDLPSIYVIGPDSHTPYKQLFPDDKTTDLTISTTSR